MKKVLVITYYWPPSGGGGVQRWLKMTKYLPDFGWKPLVVVPENPEYPVIDTSLETDICKEAEILKMPIWEPYGIFKKITGRKKNEKVNTGLLFDEKKQTLIEKISLWVRGNLLIPDPRLFWVNPTVRRLKKIIPELKPDFIITTGTPHSVHLIGKKIKTQFPKILWLADLRDPWSNLDMLDQFYASKWAKSRQKKMEASALNLADIVTTVSPSWSEEFQKSTSTPVKCITNGFDAKDFKTQKNTDSNEKFIISHIGIINSYRNPVALWSALEELCTESEEFKNKFELQIIGITDAGLGKSLDQFPLVKQKTSVTGYIPHENVVNQYQKSSCLLLLLNNSKNSKGHIPGKFFEYIASGKPILAVAPPESDVALIIKQNEFGYACSFMDKQSIKNALISIYKNKSRKFQEKSVDKFSRKNLTGQLVELMNKMLNQ